MNNNTNPKKYTSQLWSRWGTEFQITLLFSALVSGAITSANAQVTIDVPEETIVTTPVFLSENGEILNNNGEINLSGVTVIDQDSALDAARLTPGFGEIILAPVTSSADNTIINNGSVETSGTIIGESRAIDIISGSGATINNAAGSEIIASGGQDDGKRFKNTDLDAKTTLDKGVSFVDTDLNTGGKFKGGFAPRSQGNGTISIGRDADNVTLNNEGSIIANGDQGRETPYFDINENNAISGQVDGKFNNCLLYTSPSPRDRG